MSKPSNPPLFELGWDDSEGPPPKRVVTTDITLRDLFAATADVPWNAVMETLRLRGIRESNQTVEMLVEQRARMKYAEAAALLAAREETSDA